MMITLISSYLSADILFKIIYKLLQELGVGGDYILKSIFYDVWFGTCVSLRIFLKSVGSLIGGSGYPRKTTFLGFWWRVFRRGGIGPGDGEVVHDLYLEFRPILVPDFIPFLGGEKT